MLYTLLQVGPAAGGWRRDADLGSNRWAGAVLEKVKARPGGFGAGRPVVRMSQFWEIDVWRHIW